MEKIWHRRSIILIVVFLIIMLLLAVRVFYIQIISHEDLSRLAESQYEVLVEGLDTRGGILDRNNMPLTGISYKYYYFIEKEKWNSNLELLIDKIDGKQVALNQSSYYVYKTDHYDEKITDKLKSNYKAYLFKSTDRYCDEQMACHLIGYLNRDELKGVSGLELLCEEQLKAENTSLCLWADAAGTIILGDSPHKHVANNEAENINYFEKNTVITTIDRRIQYVTENALKEQEQPGAVVIMDGDTGEVLAWASSPLFNPNEIEAYLKNEDTCLVNKVCQAAYPPGSVFKIVTAIAGLENGFNPKTEYECTGSTEIEGVEINCLAGPEGGHGLLNLEKAMAVSCNCYFSRIGEVIGYEKILETARKMGLGENVLKDFPEEISGNIPDNGESGLYDTVNISIGQGALLVTPIQICQMTALVSNGGYLVSPKILLEEKVSKVAVVDKKSVDLVQEGLKGVMTHGTAKADWDIDIYGKTGTAETGSGESNSNVCWFTGYCRMDKNYVITIMLEDGTYGAPETMPILKKITDLLEKL